MNELWTMDELVMLVKKALETSAYDGQRSGRVREVPDARTIRYYTTLGLLAPPSEMRGRVAFYDRRHVQQLVAIKRLQAQGLSLSQVQQVVLGADDRKLSRWAALPTGFWKEMATVLPSPVSPSVQALLAPHTLARPGRRDSLDRTFWTATPSAAEAADTAGFSPSASPIPQVAIHLPIAEGAKLVLERVDQNRLDPDTMTRLGPVLLQLAEMLETLKLTARPRTSKQDSPNTP